MSNAELAAAPVGAPGWVLDVALAIMAGLFAAGLWLGSGMAGVALGLAVHVFVSLYHGRFGGLRKATWVMLFGGWAVSFLAAFLGSALPLNREWMVPITFAAAGSVVLGATLDVGALHVPRLRTSRVAQIVAFALAVVALCAVIQDVSHLMRAPSEPGQGRNVPILPPIGVLPVVSLLRAGPTKIVGLALVALLAILAAFWPWRRAWRFHAAPTRLPFTALWLAAAAAWVGLGLLGAQAPTVAAVAASQALACCELAFLALVPLVLARFVRPPRDGRAAVF